MAWIKLSSLSLLCGVFIISVQGKAMPGHMGMMNMTDKENGTDHNAHAQHTMHHGSFFHANLSATLLFRELELKTRDHMIIACVVVVVLAALYEGLKAFREYLKRREQRAYNSKGCCRRVCNCYHLMQGFLHMIQVFVSFCLMLIFMLFNAWLCGAVVVGAGLGYWLFAWSNRQHALYDVNEHCN